MTLITAILLGGAIAGAADIIYACAHYNLAFGLPPERILQSVAAGLIGPEAAQAGGWGTAALGLAAHFALTTAMALIFNLAALAIRPLARLWYITGPAYGLAILFAMNFVIVPMSAAGTPAGLPAGEFLVGAILAHIFLVGLPIAWLASRVRRS